MSDTIDFMQHVDVPAHLTKFFDEFMLLYRFINNGKEMTICTKDETSATFEIKTNSVDDAQELYDNLNMIEFEVYNNKYHVAMTLMEASVMTTITKVSST